MSVLGIDVGTTMAKCQVIEADGIVSSYESSEYDIVRQDGFSYIDVKSLYSSVKKIISKAVIGHKIDAICVSSLGEAFVPVGKNFQILDDAMLYTDTRGENQVENLLKNISQEEVFSICGAKAHCMYSLPKMMWLKENKPQIYNNATHLLLIGDFIGYMLTGKACIDYGLAARTMALDIRKKQWSDKLLDIAKIDKNKLSELCEAGSIIGDVRTEISKELGISNSCKVVVGSHDQICSALGAGVVNIGNSVDGMGTVECITPIFSAPSDSLDMGNCGYSQVPYAVNGLYATYIFNYTGGALVKWFKDNFAREYKSNFYEYFEDNLPLEPTDLLVLPYFAGAATPYMDSDAKGAIINLTISSTLEDIYRAILESTSFEMRLNAEIARKFGVKITELTATGGGARNKKWLQIKADIMGVPIYPLQTSEAGITGCAMLAFVALKQFTSIESAVTTLVKKGEPIYPNIANSAKYDKKFEKYKKIYKNIKEIM